MTAEMPKGASRALTMPGLRPLGLALLCLLACLTPAAAQAAQTPALRVDALANTTTPAGTQLQFLEQVTSVGAVPTDGSPMTLETILPPGMTAIGPHGGNFAACSPADGSAEVKGARRVRCTSSATLIPGVSRSPALDVAVEPGIEGPLTARFLLSGGGDSADHETARTVEVTPAPPVFGPSAFESLLSADEAGHTSTQAAAHPYLYTTTVDFNTTQNPTPVFGPIWPVAPVKDAVIDLPPGLIGNPQAADICTPRELANSAFIEAESLCPTSSQIGTIMVSALGVDVGFGKVVSGPAPLFNMRPPTGSPAEFGFNLYGTVVTFLAHIRSNGDYGVTVDSTDIPQALAIAGTKVTIWGVPADTAHRLERTCTGATQIWQNPDHSTNCASSDPTDRAFLRNPTACTGPATTTLRVDSWTDPASIDANGEPIFPDPNWKRSSYRTHLGPGLPDPPGEWGPEAGNSGCASVPFTPSIVAQPTTHEADAPTGLHVDLSIPQKELEEPEAISQSDLKDAKVTLPAGMSVNASSADGLNACNSAQIGLLGTEFPAPNPIHFTDAPHNCSDSSKIGQVKIKTPLLDHEIEGGVYLAAQKDNPFKSLLAIYLVAEDPASGTIIKLPGRIQTGPDGQLTTTFDDQPQLPFERFHLEFFGGPRAALRTPPTCGTYTTEATLTPWSGNPAVTKTSSFEITSGPNGSPCPNNTFDPKLSAGTQSPLAGHFSPFNLRLSREDATKEITGLDATLPEGLIGALKGIPYCPEAALSSIPSTEGTATAQLANPSCPAASQVGTVTAGAGAGPNPFYVQTGRAYLAGPYKGAPLSLAIITPALAGPFDLGNVLTRVALQIDPETTRITAVSDPLPTILDGIPLDLRDIRVNVDKPNFTLNPTSCDPKEITATVSGTGGAKASLSNRFQVGECGRLPFKPSLALKLSGGTKRAKHPALKATLNYPSKGSYANIAKAVVALPHSEFLDQSHIGTVCTRVQFAADQCPAKSVYGHARAITPLLDQPLEGPVYLRSSSHQLPDLVVDLNGQIHVVLDGRIDSKNGGIRNTFEVVPDAPVSKFTLSLQGGRKGLLENSTDICRSTHRASVQFDGQNGKTADFQPSLKAKCPRKKNRARR